MRLLLVEDDEGLRDNLLRELGRNGFTVDHCGKVRDAIHHGMHESYDAVVLDRGLPDGDGTEVVARLRAEGNAVPVLILTVRDAWQEKVEALSAGADDYLTKPFHLPELVARLKALLRRRYGVASNTLNEGGVVLDEARQCAVHQGQVINLTGVEFRLLRFFMLHPGKVLSRTRLYEHLYEQEAERDSNVIEVFVSHLRQKLGRELILTRRGQGYVFGGTA